MKTKKEAFHSKNVTVTQYVFLILTFYDPAKSVARNGKIWNDVISWNMLLCLWELFLAGSGSKQYNYLPKTMN